MPIHSIQSTDNQRSAQDQQRHEAEVRSYPAAARRLALDLLEYLSKVEVIMNLHDICPDRVSTDQIREARINLQTFHQKIEDQSTGIPITVQAESYATRALSFLIKWEQNRLADDHQITDSSKSEFAIGNLIKSTLAHAIHLKDTDAAQEKLKHIFELFQTEYKCAVKEIALGESDKNVKIAHKVIQTVLHNQLLIGRVLCALAVLNNARLEHGEPSDIHASQLFDRMHSKGLVDVFLGNLDKLTRFEGKYSDSRPSAINDPEHVKDSIARVLGNASDIRHLALEISNAFYHKSLTAANPEKGKQYLQDGFDAGLRLLDTIDLLSKYRQQHPNFCPQPICSSDATSSLEPMKQQSPDYEKQADLILKQTACPTLNKVADASAKLFLPEGILDSLSQEIETANDSLKKIDELIKLKVLNTHSHNALVKKKHEIEQSVIKAQATTIAYDLYKQYPVPQASHWQKLLEHDEIGACSEIKRLPTSDGSKLFEIGIQAKPTSSGDTPEKVWLHLHTQSDFKLKKKQPLAVAIQTQLDKVDAAHLKSDFFRNKGKRWQRAQQMQGKLDALVERSPVSSQFIQNLIAGIQSKSIPRQASL